MSPRLPDGVQQILEFAVDPRLDRGSLLTSAANAEAVEWIGRWPSWPARVLALYGPQGCGKTHLARIWAARAGADFLHATEVDEPLVAGFARHPRAISIDGADFIAGEAQAEQALFHLYNLVIETGQFLLLAARTPPARWGVRLPDLASRLGSVPAIAIDQPDDTLLGALLGKLFADRQLAVPDEVLSYLLARMERSFAAAEWLAGRIDRLSLARQRPVTMALARTALEEQAGETS